MAAKFIISCKTPMEKMPRRILFLWVYRFQERCEDPKDDMKSARPSISCEDASIDRVRSLSLVATLSLLESSLNRIFRDNLEIKKVSAKMVPELPTPEIQLHQKEY